MTTEKTPKVGLDRSKTGRKKGTPNKVNKELKELIRGALDAAGGQAYLQKQAEENPAAFMTLLGKIIPKDVNVGGQPENPLMVSTIDAKKLSTEALAEIMAAKDATHTG